jgi:cytochrome b5
MIYKNKVYDVTKFIQEHPAGPNYITDYAGIDATTAFDDVGHSETAVTWMLKYHVGHIN